MCCTGHINTIDVVVGAILGIVDCSPDVRRDILPGILIEGLSSSVMMVILIGSLGTKTAMPLRVLLTVASTPSEGLYVSITIIYIYLRCIYIFNFFVTAPNFP